MLGLGLADHADLALATNNLALRADALHTCSDLHDSAPAGRPTDTPNRKHPKQTRIMSPALLSKPHRQCPPTPFLRDRTASSVGDPTPHPPPATPLGAARQPAFSGREILDTNTTRGEQQNTCFCPPPPRSQMLPHHHSPHTHPLPSTPLRQSSLPSPLPHDSPRKSDVPPPLCPCSLHLAQAGQKHL